MLECAETILKDLEAKGISVVVKNWGSQNHRWRVEITDNDLLLSISDGPSLTTRRRAIIKAAWHFCKQYRKAVAKAESQELSSVAFWGGSGGFVYW